SNSTPYCNQNNMMSSHPTFCQLQPGSEQIASGDEPGLVGVMDGMNVKNLEERSEGDVASPSSTGTQQDHLMGLLDGRDDLDKEDGKPEPEAIYETNCRWESCNKEFDTQDQLVHIYTSRYFAERCFGVLQKPYVCKIPGCTKRYTDPSSLRKHVKTVHGPEAHITKKHRGDTGPRPPGSVLTPGGQTSELLLEKEETCREDCKLLAPETALKSQPSPGGSGENMVLCAPSPLNRRVMELSNHELGAGNIASSTNDRRGSGTSSLSSAYTVSRRSSMASPYLSSRRSSDVSQMGGTAGGGCHLLSPEQAGGDPLTPETYRRGVPCPGGGGLPGLPNLTPAQHYSLKAKYAAATGGPPPTPLPNMEQPGTPVRRGGPLSEYQGQPLPPFLQQGGPRRHSANTEYGTGVIYPHQAPGNNTRRASDPVRSVADPQALPKRFNSLNNVAMMGRRNALQLHSSDTGLSRHMYSPRPPSITENVMMEAMGMEPHLNTGDTRDRSMMMTPVERSFLSYPQQNQTMGGGGPLPNQLSPSHDSLGCPEPGYMQRHYQRHGGEVISRASGNPLGQARPTQPDGISNTLLQQAEYGMSTCQLSPSGPHYPSLGRGSESGSPWNDNHNQIQTSSHAIQNQQSVRYSDSSLQPQQTQAHFNNQTSLYNSSDVTHKPFIKPEQQFHSGMGGGDACQSAKLQQQRILLQQTQAYPQQSGQGIMRNSNHPNCDFQGQNPGSYSSGRGLSLGCAGSALSDGQRSETPMMQVKEMMVRNYVQSQQALMWEQHQDQEQHNGIKPPSLSDNMGLSAQTAMMQHSPEHQNQNLYSNQTYPSYPERNLVMSPAAHSRGSTSVTPKDQHLTGLQGTCYNQEMVVPRPPQGRKPLSRQNSLPQVGGGYLGGSPHISPVHSTSSPRRGVRLPPVQNPQHPPNEMFSPSNNNMYYTGQINMEMEKHRDPQNGPCLNQPNSMGPNLDPAGDSKSAPMAPYPDSSPISNALENLDLENARIDFTSIIDEADSSSFSPVNNPLQGHQGSSSQASSRLTTPQTSVSLTPGTGLSNMAVGDMTSMLTSLAGENKYLNTLS
ncbi:hypothetical protein GOODEAATRI_002807, partial [Goodea atripinnis]